MYSDMEIKFKSDTSFRKQFFVPDSFAHPAKMDAQLLIWIVERFTQTGETILDPMAGSGTLMLACTLGRNVFMVDLEAKFCKMMRDNWNGVRMRPQLGSQMGACQIIQGDARQLEGLLVDKCIFSPPYAETLQGSGADAARDRIAKGKYKGLRPDIWISKGNIAGSTFGDGYSRDPNNIGQLPYGQIDKIVTSPPYEGAMDGGSRHTKGGIPERDKKMKRLGSYDTTNEANIGKETYLEAMLQVYQQCFKVLKPQGLMILVTKNFIRDKQIVRLDTDTIKLCGQAGFTYLERHYRKLSAQSFWRTIYHQKYPEVEKIEHEDVLVFSK